MGRQPATIVVDLASVLRRVRAERHYTQADIAAILGVSQPYISRLERGQRRPQELQFLLRVSARLNLPLSDLGIAHELINDGESEDLYEAAVQAIGAYDFPTAEALFMRLVTGGRQLAIRPYLRCKAKQRLASIRRDRFELEGPEGAFALYRQCLDGFEADGALSATRETHFLIGACHEMTENWLAAETEYQFVLEMAQAMGSRQAEARAKVRLGVIQTKRDDLVGADVLLKEARSIAVTLDSATPYAFATEKHALLRLREDRLDQAHDLAEKAKSEIVPSDGLRIVQNHLVAADIAIAARESRDAARNILSAREVAVRYEFRHQLLAIDRFIGRLAPE